MKEQQGFWNLHILCAIGDQLVWMQLYCSAIIIWKTFIFLKKSSERAVDLLKMGEISF